MLGVWSKVLYSFRTVPPDAQQNGLRSADSDLRAAMGQLIGRTLSGDDWRLASLGIAAGGLGARCAAEHAPAAYVASFSACRGLCGQLWPAFDPFDLDRGLPPSGGRRCPAQRYPSGANDTPRVTPHPQKSLSGMIEAQSVSSIFRRPQAPQTPPPPPRSLPSHWGWGLAHRQPVVHELSRSFAPLPGGPPAPSSYAFMGSRLGMWHVW